VDLLAYCEAHALDIVQTIETLVRLESPSTDKAAVDRCGAVLVDMLRAAGAVEAAFRGLHPVRPGTRLTIKGGFERPPMERTAAVAALFARASEVASSLGRELGEGAAGGGSDGNFTAALGVPTLDGLGAVGDGAHAAHEHVDVTTLAWRAALLAGLLASFR